MYTHRTTTVIIIASLREGSDKRNILGKKKCYINKNTYKKYCA